MKYTICEDKKHQSPFRMQAVHEKSGEIVSLDAGEQVGGSGSAFSPMELVALGLAGCSCIDVISILRKSKQAYSDVRVETTTQRVSAIPATFSSIHLNYLISGDVEEKVAQRAARLSVEKYCSVSKMLSDGGVKITYTVTLQQ